MDEVLPSVSAVEATSEEMFVPASGLVAVEEIADFKARYDMIADVPAISGPLLPTLTGSRGTMEPSEYEEPNWSAVPKANDTYYLDVLKNGVIINRIDLNAANKSFYSVGRLPGQCDICSEHPSSSRLHAVLQFGRRPPDEQQGFYLFDLKSVHGTFLNKSRIPAEEFVRLHVGFVMKFGGSTRLYVLQGPSEDEERESDLSVVQLKALAASRSLEKKLSAESKDASKEEEDSGVDWGFGPDATDEAEEKEIGFLESTTVDDSYYAEDPKKALNAFFVREGMDMEYDVEEIGQGYKKQFHCRIPLPVETPNGRQMVAEAVVHGKKKEALAAAILEACRILHAKGMLKGTTSIGRQKKSRNWADEDFYDSDEDTFLDRTGTVEKKRQQRIRRSGALQKETETFESLTERLAQLKTEVFDINSKLQKADENKAATMGDGGLDALDSFMDAIKSGLIMDPKTKIKLRQRLAELRLEETRLVKLINIVKPMDLPPVQSNFAAYTKNVMELEKSNQAEGFAFGRLKPPALPPSSAPVYHHDRGDRYEVEEDEDETDTIKSVSLVPNTEDGANGIRSSTDTDVTSRKRDLISGHSAGSSPENARKKALEESSGDIVASGSLSELRPYIQPSKKKRTEPRNAKYEYDASDPDYTMWIPPSDQAGDGRTSLNERLGY